jgi:predicted lipid-binding transport protein (Tim44 family)
MPPERNAIMSEDELNAAIAEIESSPEAAKAIPDLGDGSDSDVVRIPANQPKPVQRTAKPKPEPAPAAPEPAPGLLVEDAARADAARPAQRPNVGAALVRALDVGLDLINQPFQGLAPSTRTAIGLAAIVTLVMSLVFMLIGPALLKPTTAFEFVQEKRAALSTPLRVEAERDAAGR